MSNPNEKQVHDQPPQSRDSGKSMVFMVEQIDEILKITDSYEMDNRIAKNTSNIRKIFEQFLNKLYSKTEVSKDQIDLVIYSLKFVDTLNLFMPHFIITELQDYMDKIFNMVSMSNNNTEVKDLILKQIKYTEMTVINLKKQLFKTHYFGDGKALAKEIEINLDQVNRNGKFEQRLFKQLQNLFYVVQGRIEENKRNELQQRLNEMKMISIKYKKQKFNPYYDDYNDYSDYKNYSNVSGNLHDYNENFYENEDYSYFNYNNQERYGYRRYSYRNNNYYHKHFENEEREIENVIELEGSNSKIQQKETYEDKRIYLKEVEEVNPQGSVAVLNNPAIEMKENMNTPVFDNKTHETIPFTNLNANNDIEIIKSVVPSKSHHDYNSNSHYHRGSYSNQSANQSSQGISNEYTPIKKKIILKKNQKQRGQILIEVPIPNNSDENKHEVQTTSDPPKQLEIETDSRKPIEPEIKTEESKPKDSSSNSVVNNQNEKEQAQPSQAIQNQNETEIITTVINTNQDTSNQGSNFSQKQYNNPKYNQYGYKQNSYTKNQGYYYNYNSNHHNNNFHNNHYHYYPGNQAQNSQGGFKQQNINNQSDNFNNYPNSGYYKKNSQNKKYYQPKTSQEFVELDELKFSDKQDQSAKSSPDIKRDEIVELPKSNDDKETVKMDLEKMFEKEKQKEIDERNKVALESVNNKLIELKQPILEENTLAEQIHDIEEEHLSLEESEIDEDNEEMERDESSESIEDEEIEREYNKFISESLGQIPKNLNDDNYYIDQEGDSKKNNKIVFEDEANQEDNKPTEEKSSNMNPSMLLCPVNPQVIVAPSELISTNDPGMIIPTVDPAMMPSNEKTLAVEENDSNICKEDVANMKEYASSIKEDLLEQQPSDQISKDKEETSISENAEQYKSNKYIDSIKTIDPKILMTIKSKLSEDYEKNQQNQSHQNIPAYVNYQASFPNGNSQMFHPSLLSIMAYYQNQMPNSKISLQNYIFSHYSQFLYHGRDSNIHKEYMLLKAQEIENSFSIWQNINNFENKIIVPIYQRINFNVNKKRKVYYFTFIRYKKLIQKLLSKDKVLEKVKPYGSYMNNFLIDSGDIDICIVPKCNILEFASYLDKIKEEIVVKNIGEHKLSHHTGRYLLLKVLDNQTKFIIDITVHTMLPILNTNLVRLYSLYDQRFHILGLYIKHWAKINKIHGAADNFLSSYALLLMLIHFLQKIVEPRVLPNLQKIENKEVLYQYYVNGETIKTNIYYEEDLNKIKPYMKKINNGLENKETATNLLVKFFEYYSYYFESEKRISIHKDVQETAKKTTETIAFSIEDPFDIQHDPGKSMAVNSVQCNKFITSMKKEINYILNGEYVKRIDKICSSSNPGKN